jgi:hypothetical protein
MTLPLFPDAAPAHDPGGKVRLPLEPGVVGWAYFSECKRYRHLLGRHWAGGPDDDVSFEPYAMWIGMNPSTAEENVDDPTVRREIRFTRRFGLRGYIKFNVMDYRATSPDDLLKEGVEPRSSENMRWILDHARLAEQIIICHGALHPKLQHYGDEVVQALLNQGEKLSCLGLTKHGSPRHPLYLPNGTRLVRYYGCSQ